MTRIYSIFFGIVCLISSCFLQGVMDSSRGDITILYILLFLASTLGGLSLLFGGITGDYDISMLLEEKKTDYHEHKEYIKKEKIYDKQKMFQVDYFINNKRYGIPAREIVAGANIAEVRAKYQADPKVKRILQVKPLQ